VFDDLGLVGARVHNATVLHSLDQGRRLGLPLRTTVAGVAARQFTLRNSHVWLSFFSSNRFFNDANCDSDSSSSSSRSSPGVSLLSSLSSCEGLNGRAITTASLIAGSRSS